MWIWAIDALGQTVPLQCWWVLVQGGRRYPQDIPAPPLNASQSANLREAQRQG